MSLNTGAPQFQRDKTHCPMGHEYTPENTKIWKGNRSCKKCLKIYKADLYQRNKAKRLGEAEPEWEDEE